MEGQACVFNGCMRYFPVFSGKSLRAFSDPFADSQRCKKTRGERGLEVKTPGVTINIEHLPGEEKPGHQF